MQMWSVTTWIIVINIAVYILNRMTTHVAVDELGKQFVRAPIWDWGYFSIEQAVAKLQIWRFISFQFLHDPQRLGHILFNMFTLYFFGPMVEAFLGRRRFLAFYLLCGVGGPVAYGFLWFFRILLVSKTTALIGASAGIYGVLVAAAVIAPDETVLVFGSIPAKLRTVAWVLLGIAVFSAFTGGANAGGEAAHIGGAIVGFFLIRRPKLLNVFELGYHSGRRRMTYR
jgi:membrane associated rhomboid family serine protease